MYATSIYMTVTLISIAFAVGRTSVDVIANAVVVSSRPILEARLKIKKISSLQTETLESEKSQPSPKKQSVSAREAGTNAGGSKYTLDTVATG